MRGESQEKQYYQDPSDYVYPLRYPHTFLCYSAALLMPRVKLWCTV